MESSHQDFPTQQLGQQHLRESLTKEAPEEPLLGERNFLSRSRKELSSKAFVARLSILRQRSEESPTKTLVLKKFPKEQGNAGNKNPLVALCPPVYKRKIHFRS